MKIHELAMPLVKLPRKKERIIFMIKEDLKFQRLLNSLDKAGFGAAHFQSDLGVLILLSVGFERPMDDVLSWYLDLMRKYAKRVDAYDNNIVLFKKAFNIYEDIVAKKKGMKEG